MNPRQETNWDKATQKIAFQIFYPTRRISLPRPRVIDYSIELVGITNFEFYFLMIYISCPSYVVIFTSALDKIMRHFFSLKCNEII